MRAALALAATALAAAALPANADAGAATRYGPWTVTSAGHSGSFTVDAGCVFGPMIVGEPPQLYATGVASAPGALSTTIRCHFGRTVAARTLPGSAAAVSTRGHWDTPGELCVSAEATFVHGTAVAPTVCVTP